MRRVQLAADGNTARERELFPYQLRLRIMQDAGRGMEYLHGSNPPVLHLDLKSPNLLLDSAQYVLTRCG